MEKNSAVIAARIPHNLKDLINDYLDMDTHLNESDFLRAAVREKIRRDAPHLFNKMMKKEG